MSQGSILLYLQMPAAGGGLKVYDKLGTKPDPVDELGFEHVAAGPLVRSSYHADEHVPQARPGVGPLAAAT